MPTTARTSRKPTPATSSRSPASRMRAPATRSAIRRSRSSSRRWNSPIRSSRSRSSRRPRATRRSSAWRCPPGGRGPVLPRLDRPGERPDHPQGHGRAPSRHQGRHPQAHLQGRRQRRRAAGRLSRDDHAAGTHAYTHKKQTGGSGQFAQVELDVEPSGAGNGNDFEIQDRRRRGAEGIHPRRREGRRVGPRPRVR